MTGYLCRNAQVARFFVGKEMLPLDRASGAYYNVIACS